MLVFKQIEKVKLSFHYMRDNHTFIKIPTGNSLNDLKKNAIEIAKQNPWGMVCPVIVTNESTGKEIRRTDFGCHVNSEGDCDINKWIQTLKDDKDILFYFKKLK